MKKLLSTIKCILTVALLIFFKSASGQLPDWTLDCKASTASPVLATDFAGSLYVIHPINAGPSYPVMIGNYTLTQSANLLKFDASGQVAWTQNVDYYWQENNRSMAVSQTSNNSPLIYLCGAEVPLISHFLPTLFKFDENGSLIWQQSATGPLQNSVSTSVAVDHNGNIFTTGFFDGSDVSFGSHQVNRIGNSMESFLAKYDSTGNPLWAINAGLKDCSGQGSEICISSDNSIYIMVNSKDYNVIFANDTLYKNNANNYNLFLLKFDQNGNPLWGRSIGGATGNVFGADMASDANGNVIVTGNYTPPINITGFTTGNILAAKFDSTGNRTWAKHETSTMGNSYSVTISVDALGNSFIAGSITSAFVQFDNITIANYDTFSTSRGGDVEDSWYAKLDPNGNFVYAEAFGGITASGQEITSIACDPAGKLFVGGYYNSPFMIIGNDTLTNTLSQRKLFLAKLNSTTIGVEEYGGHESLFIYPNPSENIVKIFYPDNFSGVNTLSVYDEFGKLIFSNESIQGTIHIDISQFTSGMYFVCVEAERGRITGRFIKI
jgi:hypothetical protein